MNLNEKLTKYLPSNDFDNEIISTLYPLNEVTFSKGHYRIDGKCRKSRLRIQNLKIQKSIISHDILPLPIAYNKAFKVASNSKKVRFMCYPYDKVHGRAMPTSIIEPFAKFARFLNGNDKANNRLKDSIDCINMAFDENPPFPTFGLYKCTTLLGSGSFSKVYEATKSGEIKTYAVKVLRFDESQSKLAVLNEIYIMKMMNETGKSIPLINSYVSVKGAIIIMEKTLTDMKQFYLKNVKTIDTSFILYYWESMMKCVIALHEKKIVHLDLKLQNFVITEDLQVKLLDYGISKLVTNGDAIKFEDIIETVIFMSPELLLGAKEIMPYKCDIWSMGIVLYTMVFNCQPVKATSVDEYIAKMADPNLIFPHPLCDKNGVLLTKLMKGCLQREPRLRMDANQLVEMIDTALY